MKYLKRVRSHFDRLLNTGLDTYGAGHTPMWMASLDVNTGRYPDNDKRPEHIGKRVYRYIDAPRGCSLYWDQPSIVAAHALSTITGNSKYSNAADAYVRCFLERCVARNGMFLWGNHYYYDAFLDCVVRFHGNEVPCPVDPRTEQGELHEIRPLMPAWETFQRVDPAATARAIRAAAEGHLVDPETGEFQRHAEGNTGCAFLEAGGILVESLAWLFAKTGDKDLLPPAAAMAGYSFRHRHSQTGLLENNPTWTRWDKITATCEVGLWAGCLLRAGTMADCTDWVDMAADALASWLGHAYDETAGCYCGRLRVATGEPVFGPKETVYQPGDYCDLWEPLFPAHDYPMACAEACLAFHRRTGKEVFRLACERWARQIKNSLPARNGRGGYAEHYGRCIHFLLGCADEFGADYRGLAELVAAEALQVLFANGMFRGHPGEDRYDAVDGVGFLALALLRLDTGTEPDCLGLGW